MRLSISKPFHWLGIHKQIVLYANDYAMCMASKNARSYHIRSHADHTSQNQRRNINLMGLSQGQNFLLTPLDNLTSFVQRPVMQFYDVCNPSIFSLLVSLIPCLQTIGHNSLQRNSVSSCIVICQYYVVRFAALSFVCVQNLTIN